MQGIREPHLRFKKHLEIASPVVCGLVAGIAFLSPWWAIAGGIMGILLAAAICSQFDMWVSGPRWDELRHALHNFDQYSVNDDRFYMHAGERPFNIYREEFKDRSYVLGIELLWEQWRDVWANHDSAAKLKDKASNFEEGTKGIYLEAGEGVDQLSELINCLLDVLELNLTNLEFKMTFGSGARFDGVMGKGGIRSQTTGIEK